MGRIYLDHNATSPLRPQVQEAIQPYLAQGLANPNSIHTSGRKMRDAIEEARMHVASLMGVSPSDLIFTSGGTEANHLAWQAHQKAGHRILTSGTEHACNAAAAEKAREAGAEVEVLKIDRQGQVTDAAQLNACVWDFVSLHYANNETGIIWPLSQWASQLKAKHPGVTVHSDAVQLAGKQTLQLKKDGLDYASISGHKLGALAGCGALYRKRCSPIEAIWQGGPQEKGRRSGTENVLGIIAMGAACAHLLENAEKEALHLKQMRDALERELTQRISDIEIAGIDQPRLPQTSGIIFHGASAEAVLIAADLAGMDVSTGAACSSGSIEPSPVYLAMGFSQAEAKSAIRFSLGWNTTPSDIDQVIGTFPALVEQARRMRSTR